MRNLKFSLRVIAILTLFFTTIQVNAAIYYSRATGSFNTKGTWSVNTSGNPKNNANLKNTDTFIIQNGHNITLNGNRTATAVTIQGGGKITLNGTRILTSPLTINSGGILNVANRQLTMRGNLSNAGAITITTGILTRTTYSLTNSGTITMGAGQFIASTGGFTNTNSGTLAITGTATVTLGTGDFINSNTSADVDFGSSDITVDGANQSIGGFTTAGLFSNTNAGMITLTGNIIAGGFTNNGAGKIDLGTGNIHTISGDWTITAGTVLGNTSTLEVSGTVSGAGTFTANTGTIAFNGTGAQTIPALDYYNLIGAGGIRTLANSGTIGIAGEFTSGTGTYIITGSTVNFNGTSTQTIPEFNFNNLNASGGDRTLEYNGTIGIAGIFTPGGGSYTITGSTVSFNGSGSQIIPVFNYNHLNGSGGDRILDDSGTIGIAGEFTPGAGNYTVAGSTVSFNGLVAQTIPEFTFEDLIIKNAGDKTVNESINVRNLTIETGTIFNLNSSGGGELNLYIW